MPEILAWLPKCGEGWSESAASFVGMWTAMMTAMMLPSLVPVLLRFRLAIPAALAATGYFLVWTVVGALVYAVLAAFAEFTFRVPAIADAGPWLLATVVLLAGAFQLSACKAHHLACCRPGSREQLTFAGAAWRFGIRLGLHCIVACAGLTALLLVAGMMDWRAMAVAAAVITAERLAPQGQRVAWAAGAVSIATGVYLMARASF